MYDLVIVGAGPAGVTAGIYAARKGLKFVIVAPETGGQLLKTSVIENYLGFGSIDGFALAQNFEKHFAEFAFDYRRMNVDKIIKKTDFFEVLAGTEKFETKTVLWAAGALPRYLHVPGESKLRARGVTYCTTCDGPFFREKSVAVIGGGNTALESVLQLSAIATKVFVVNLTADFTGDAVLIQKVQKLQNVEILHKTQTLEILGENKVAGLKVLQHSKEKILDLEGVFINIGYFPQTEQVRDLVTLNAFAEIVINAKGETSLQGFFAAGDCTNMPYKQIVTAAGAGATAALSVFKYLSRTE